MSRLLAPPMNRTARMILRAICALLCVVATGSIATAADFPLAMSPLHSQEEVGGLFHVEEDGAGGLIFSVGLDPDQTDIPPLDIEHPRESPGKKSAMPIPNRTSNYSFFLVVLLTVTFTLPALAQTVADFPDPNLEAAIRGAIAKPRGPIYETDLEGLSTLAVLIQGHFHL